ncbi:hypothetical protein [Streptosporangium roseum]|uniref:Uncharacterized protein n=1 Tax=Streptosporangium roseum (strain ATCC 12428 / DSM 43021 / JCM 3005 / KCTC 9067 / NCIMB 10171 / NRRL 2505 / NI 9100) TaxID=479432 RepID=D2B9B3_STRRD|nr:hypothetical protein [Streptosporangium roseum]ACZ91658.1 hypothetical protein Sros_9027 [Streptosporangium roseum DSM 43021]
MTLRRGLIGLTVLSILGTAFELATERHWQTWEQCLPWGALVLLAAGVVLPALHDSPRVIMAVRWLASAVLLVALFGVYVHVAANHEAGFLDQGNAGTWETLPALSRWWYALTKSVGPTPPLAPGMLAQTAFLLLLATLARRTSGRSGPSAPAVVYR